MSQPQLEPELITPPTSEPVTLAEARDHARIGLDCDDAVLAALIIATRMACENFLGRALIEQTWKIVFDWFPVPCLDLPKGVLSVTSFNVIAEDDTSTLVDAANYHVTTGQWGRLALKNSVTLPTTERRVDAFEVVWVAGFGTDWNAVPQHIRQGMLQLILHLYENRGEEIIALNPGEIVRASKVSGAEALWLPSRRIRIL